MTMFDKNSDNKLEINSPKRISVYKLFEEKAQNIPDNIAIKFKNETISYNELLKKVNFIAYILRLENIHENDIVALMMKRTIDIIVGILAILKVGAAYLPIDPDYPEQRIEFMLKDSGVSFLLTHSMLRNDKINNLKILCIDKLYDYNIKENINVFEEPKLDSLAYVIYTSGSTGNPKGVMIELKSVLNFFNGITKIIDFTEGKKILALTTISFDISVLEIILPLVRGLTVVLADENMQKNPKLLSSTIQDNCIDMIQITPSMLQLLGNYDEKLNCFRNLKEVMIGGEAFPQNLLDKIRNYTNAKIYNMYGPTETTIWSTVSDLTEKNIIDIGKPIINTLIYIIDENNCKVPVGNTGELYIGGRGLARGYLNRPKLTIERFVENPFIPGERMYKTGDLAKWLPDGNIQYVGRIDNQVKIRGYRIELEEIEIVLMGYKSIKQVVVSSWPSKDNNKCLCAYFVSDEELNLVDIREYLNCILPEYMVPSYFVRLNAMPQTPNGKIDRKALPDPESILISKQREESEADDVWLKIREIIKKNIDVPVSINKIDLSTSLVDLGINSITFIKIVVTLEKEFEFVFEDEDLGISKFSTIQSLVTYVENMIAK